MKCAIITCSEYKKKIFSPTFFQENLSLPFINDDILIINLPYTTDKFYKLSENKRKKTAERICKLLYKKNVYCIHLAGITNCTDFSCLSHRFYLPEGKTLIKKFAATGAYILSNQLKLNLSEAKISLYQKNFNHTGFEILCDFARYFKNITIIGDSFETLTKYREHLMDICGLSINITTKISSASSCDFLFLLDEAENICTDDKTVIIDLIKKYPFHCLNSLKFELPSGFNKLLPYFGEFDDICLEFILYLSNSHDTSNEDIFKTIGDFGGVFKRFCAKSKIMLDKQ